MTLYTSTVVGAAQAPAGVEAHRRRTSLYAIGLPFLLLVLWGVWATGRAREVLPRAARDPRGVRRHLGRSARSSPTSCRASAGSRSASSLSIAIGVVAGTLIGLNRWLRELLEPLLEFFRAIPPPVLIPIVMLLMGITDAMKVASSSSARCGRCC